MSSSLLQSCGNWADRYFGRGSYPRLRRLLAPYQEYSYFVHAEWVQRLVGPKTRWLDAGCGHQSLESRLHREEQQIVDSARLAVGCDGMWSSVSRHRSLKRLVTCDVSALPFAEASFDLVSLNMVAEHLQRPDVVMAEIARVLDDGGLLLIHTPNAAGYGVKLAQLTWRVVPQTLVHKLIRFLEYREPEDVFPTFYKANTQKTICDLVSSIGLEEQEFKFVEGRPCFYFLAPLSILEIAFCRCLRFLGRKDLTAGEILAVYRKKPRPSSSDERYVSRSGAAGLTYASQKRNPMRSPV
jgi:ubiquinone/menaquinone biosynthesis C-methylase UbiE